MGPLNVTFPGGERVDVTVGDFVVHTDQPRPLGEGTAPDPFSLFLASLATCAGFYVQAFCKTRGINPRGVELSLETQYDDNKQLREIALTIRLPAGFPERYVAGVQAAAASCKVKKLLAAPPNVVVRVEPTQDPALTRPRDHAG